LDESDDLLRRCSQGDQAALTELVRCYQERIFRLACRVTGDEALAEEATAQALLKIWTRAGQWRGQAKAGTWIYRLAVRTVLDVQRSQRRWWRRWAGPWPRLAADSRPDPTHQAVQHEQQDAQAQRVQQALQQLSEADRALVHLFYFDNHSLAEIEAILGVPRANLKMRLLRARQRLRSLLESEHETD
jgi:RNA polymerase sigma-70 factor (ECF subfamily)